MPQSLRPAAACGHCGRVATPEVRKTLATNGITPLAMEREVLGSFIAHEVVRLSELSRAAGIVPQ